MEYTLTLNIRRREEDSFSKWECSPQNNCIVNALEDGQQRGCHFLAILYETRAQLWIPLFSDLFKEISLSFQERKALSEHRLFHFDMKYIAVHPWVPLKQYPVWDILISYAKSCCRTFIRGFCVTLEFTLDLQWDTFKNGRRRFYNDHSFLSSSFKRYEFSDLFSRINSLSSCHFMWFSSLWIISSSHRKEQWHS